MNRMSAISQLHKGLVDWRGQGCCPVCFRFPASPQIFKISSRRQIDTMSIYSISAKAAIRTMTFPAEL